MFAFFTIFWQLMFVHITFCLQTRDVLWRTLFTREVETLYCHFSQYINSTEQCKGVYRLRLLILQNIKKVKKINRNTISLQTQRTTHTVMRGQKMKREEKPRHRVSKNIYFTDSVCCGFRPIKFLSFFFIPRLCTLSTPINNKVDMIYWQ